MSGKMINGHGQGHGSGDGYGYGYGDGHGDGYGSGYGYGDGDGDGYGDGYGHGSGYGHGHGHGDGDGDGLLLGTLKGYEVKLFTPWNYIKVGCQIHSLEQWEKNWRKISKKVNVRVSKNEVDTIRIKLVELGIMTIAQNKV